MANELVAFDKTELRMVFKALKNMGEEANDEAKRQSGALAEFARAEVIQTASRGNNTKVSGRIAQGSRVKKSSRIGEITYGFASQKFSGGATTRDIWGGTEFGSNKFRQFPVWSSATNSLAIALLQYLYRCKNILCTSPMIHWDLSGYCQFN